MRSSAALDSIHSQMSQHLTELHDQKAESSQTLLFWLQSWKISLPRQPYKRNITKSEAEKKFKKSN